MIQPREAYDKWKSEEWQPPIPRPMAMPGKLIVEFAPPAQHGALWTADANEESNNARVVSDGDKDHGRFCKFGYLPVGSEIGYTEKEGTYFEHEGRRLCVIPKTKVAMLMTA